MARLLAAAPRTLACDQGDDVMEVELASPTELDALQVGYAISPEGESLLGGEGYWQPQWLVVGTCVDLGDPVFVDLDEVSLPVYTAQHGMGSWTPEPLADALEEMLR